MTYVGRPTRHLCRGVARLDDSHKRLMLAVLQTAVYDTRGSISRRAADSSAPTNPRDLREAIAYVASTDRAWPFSFENLCEVLGMDAGRLRRELQKEHGA